MNHIEHDDPMKTPPRKKQKVSNNIHAVSYSSGVDITDQREIISPMKDWNMFYDDRQDEILYQTWTGDEMTIKDKIHNEIEMFVRGNDDLDRFWTIIGDIETVHTENIDNYKQHQKNKSTITDFTKDDLYGIFSDYFTDDMDTAMEDSKQTVTENPSISETERNQTLRDAERYVLVRDAVNERIKQYNIQQKGETLGGKKTNRKTNRKTKRKTKKRKGGMPPKKPFPNQTKAQKYLSISKKTAYTYPNLSAAFYDGSLDKMEAATDRIDDQLSRPHGAERHAISPIPQEIERRTISPIPPSFEPKKGGKRKTKKRRTRSKRHSKRHSKRKRKHQRK